MKNIVIFLLSALVVVLLSVIGIQNINSGGAERQSTAQAKEKDTKKTGAGKTLKIGATSGPYADMVKEGIAPGLEAKGYKVEVVEYTDYIQPNQALDKGELDANLYQNRVYLKNFNKENGTKLSALLAVPTAPMGIYSNKYKSIEDIPDGAEIAIPNDPTNLARALQTLVSAGLLELDKDTNPLTVSERDIKVNKKKLKFVPMEAAQLPRSVDNIGLSAVNGNFALAAKMKLEDAVIIEKMSEDYVNRIVVQTKNKDNQVSKDIKEVAESKDFNQLLKTSFKGFAKPE